MQIKLNHLKLMRIKCLCEQSLELAELSKTVQFKLNWLKLIRIMCKCEREAN